MDHPPATPSPVIPARRPLSPGDLRSLLGLVVLLGLGWYLAQSLRSTLLLFALVAIVAMVLNPVVAWAGKKGLPRGLAVAVLLLVFLGLVALGLWFVVPSLLDQLQKLFNNAPQEWNTLRGKIQEYADRYPMLQQVLPATDDVADMVGNKAGNVAVWAAKSTFGLVGALFTLVFALLLLVFLLSDPEPLISAYLQLVPDAYRAPARRSLARLMAQMVAWARGVCINGAITGVSTGLLLWLVGVQPALVFGLIAFLGEFIPNVGPVLVALPALFVALSMGATKFWLALAAILFVQQVESNLLVPFVLGKSMDLNSVLILFFTLAMASLFGLAGAVLALPAAALTVIVVDEFYLRPRQINHAEIDAAAKRLASNDLRTEE
ncbi:MAG: AI-2E family transporter [Gluconacetobacter diazotrophicus]|nr:AI-2E family transporter [Gluconacetobacter diazotrophicus]